MLVAGVLGLLLRVQLALPQQGLVPPPLYDRLFTAHGTVMMILFAVPVVQAAAVCLLPAMLGARDLPFPRLTAYAFWTYALGGAVFLGALLLGQAPAGGWTMYPPLSSYEQAPGIGTDLWLLAVVAVAISALAGAINLIVAVLRMRAPGNELRQDARLRLEPARGRGDDPGRIPAPARGRVPAGARARAALAVL